MAEVRIDIAGLPVQVLRGGAGPPLLYLHGTAPSGAWLPVHERLAARFTVTAPDLPGFGGTPDAAWVEGMDDLVLHTREVMDALSLQRPLVVGFSLGGWLAAALAVWYPERIGGLVLAAAGGLHVPEAPIPDLFALTGKRLVTALFHDPAKSHLLFGAAPSVEDRVRSYRELTVLARLAWNPWFDPKLERRLRQVTAPALLVWGAEDRLIPPIYAEAYRAALPDARVRLLPECGHMLPLEQPEVFADAVIAFHEERCAA